MAWHDNWNAMRGCQDQRTWLTRSDLLSEARKRGYNPTTTQVSYLLKVGRMDRPPSVYGHYRFTKHHLNQLLAHLETLQERKAALAARRKAGRPAQATA